MKTTIPFQQGILLGLLILLTAFSAQAAFFFCIDDDFGYHWEARAIKSTGGTWMILGTVDVDGETWNINGQYNRRDLSFKVNAINPSPDDCYTMSSSFEYDGTLIIDGSDYFISFKWTNNCGGVGFANGDITPGCRGPIYDGPRGTGEDFSHTDPFRVENPFAPETATASIDLNAFPNPFTTSLTIEVELSQAAMLDAEVYDLQGRRVRQFAKQQMDAGTQIISWDGTDASGNQLPSGIYVLHVNGATQTLQLIAR